MIDAEEELFDELARLVLEASPGAYVSGEHVEVPARFPAVSIIETSNKVEESREDTSGSEVAAELGYTVNVYSNSASGAKRECKAIMEVIDERMRLRNMRRAFSGPVSNEADPSIYRLTASYAGSVDRNGICYRR
jgi:hypothetical protein